MVPIPAEVWERLKAALKDGRRVSVTLEIDRGVVIEATFAEQVMWTAEAARSTRNAER